MKLSDSLLLNTSASMAGKLITSESGSTVLVNNQVSAVELASVVDRGVAETELSVQAATGELTSWCDRSASQCYVF